jgi:hypothetical protein
MNQKKNNIVDLKDQAVEHRFDKVIEKLDALDHRFDRLEVLFLELRQALTPQTSFAFRK